MPHLLLIEDEATLAKNIALYLTRYGWEVDIATTAEEALERSDPGAPDVALLDFNLPGMDGLAALPKLRARDPQLRVVMMTGHANVQLAVDAMKGGTTDFISKPVVLAELRRLLDKLVDDRRLRVEVAYHHARAAGGLDDLVGACTAMAELKARIRRAVQVHVTDGTPPPSILVTGETGSGKELVARATHFESPRRAGPFIELNCASIPANLLESELFGHERGAFTDARERKIGLIEAADGGTLFLDEIGEADTGLQAKLLKVIEDQRFRRLGSVQERRVDVRVVAATNQPLEQRVREGKFRADLLYRLRVLHFAVPALRARGEDVELLAERFLQQFGRKYAKPPLALAPGARAALRSHPWPGNVRELRNLMEQTVLLAASDVIEASDLALQRPVADSESMAAAGGGTMALATVEVGLLRQALEKTEWNITQAAQILGISRDTMRYRIEKYGLMRSE